MTFSSFNDSFTYADGNLVGVGGWVQTTINSNPITGAVVSSGAVTSPTIEQATDSGAQHPLTGWPAGAFTIQFDFSVLDLSTPNSAIVKFGDLGSAAGIAFGFNQDGAGHFTVEADSDSDGTATSLASTSAHTYKVTFNGVTYEFFIDNVSVGLFGGGVQNVTNPVVHIEFNNNDGVSHAGMYRLDTISITAAAAQAVCSQRLSLGLGLGL